MKYSDKTGILTIATPAKIQTHTKFILSLLETIQRIQFETKYKIDIQLLPGKSNINHARSILLSQWYDRSQDNDLFLFIDSDQTFIWRDIYRLMDLEDGDVRCMVYGNKMGYPCVHPKDPQSFFKGQNTEVFYAGTGFMMITRPILHKCIDYLKNEYKIKDKNGELQIPRTWISHGENGIIPFFHQRIIESEMMPNPLGQLEWLGEDYAFCYLARHSGGLIRALMSPTLGHDISSVHYFNPPNVSSKEWSNNSIVYYCGRSNFVWDLDHANIFTGSEQAVYYLTKVWANTKEVHVYCNLLGPDKVINNVHYHNYKSFDPSAIYYNLILWRGFGLEEGNTFKAKHLYIDLHDATNPNILASLSSEKVEKYFLKSNFHYKLFESIIPKEKTIILENGLQVEMYSKVRELNLQKCTRNFIWSSCWSRGLKPILEFFWPTMISMYPDARLHVLYGNDLLKASQPELNMEIEKLIQNSSGVVVYGRLSQEQTAQVRFQCDYHLYLHASLTEIDCISIRENYLTKTIPIISAHGVFSERDGIQILGDPSKEEPYKIALTIIKELEDNPSKKEEIRNQLSQSKLTKSWTNIADEWLKIINL